MGTETERNGLIEPNRKAASSLLIDLIGRLSALHTDSALLTPQAVEALHRKLDLLLYHISPRAGVSLNPPARPAVAARRCTECDTDALPLYNIAASANGRAQGEHWRCLKHIPPGITFPIGLWGVEWEASGRKPLPSKDER